LHKIEPSPASKKLRPRGTGSASKEYDVDCQECEDINSTPSVKTDVAGAKVLLCNIQPQRVFQGQVPGYESFVLSIEVSSDIGGGIPTTGKN